MAKMINSTKEWPDRITIEGNVYNCVSIIYEYKSPSVAASNKDYDMSIRITKESLPDYPEEGKDA